MDKRGRPTRSKIRENIVEILYFLEESYGYQIHQVYKEIFPAVTLRVIYYHLKKGVELNLFKVENIKKEKGEYSWGGEAEKVYYKLGPEANPSIQPEVKEYFENKKQ